MWIKTYPPPPIPAIARAAIKAFIDGANPHSNVPVVNNDRASSYMYYESNLWYWNQLGIPLLPIGIMRYVCLRLKETNHLSSKNIG